MVSKNQKKIKSGSVHENVEINDEYFDKSFRNSNSQMELAMQIICNDKTVRSDTVQDLKEFNSQSSTTQAKK